MLCLRKRPRMARLASHRELGRLTRQYQHIQDYYKRQKARESERIFSATVPMEEADLSQARSGLCQEGNDGLPITFDRANDAVEGT